VDAARLFDPPVVAGIAKAWAQTESAEVEPARFEGRALLAAIGIFQEDIRQLANGFERPRVAAETERLLQPRGQFFGLDRRFTARREDCANELNGLPYRLFADDGGRLAHRRFGRTLAQFELEPPAIVADLRFAPGLECADFREPRPDLHRDQALARFLAEADHGVERGVHVQLGIARGEVDHLAEFVVRARE